MTRATHRIIRAILLLLALHPATAATRYVDVNSANPTPPFTNWATAARVIQDAVDAAAAGDVVLVTSGVYATGGRTLEGYDSPSRVAVTKPLTLRSVDGPEVTVIDGWQTGGGYGVYLADGAVLNGLTVTKAVWGVVCDSTNAMLTNCIIRANLSGGGCFRGTLSHCTLAGNGGSGGACNAVLYQCTLAGNGAGVYGGGACSSTLDRCLLTGNHAGDYGGGAHGSTLNHCVIANNSADLGGGGVYQSTLNHCTIVGNRTYGDGGGSSGNGFSGSKLSHCIVYSNQSRPGPAPNYADSSLSYCSTWPLPTDGVGNITNEPAFVDLAGGDFRLRPDSPCINAGNNTYVSGATDLGGNPRIVGGTVDIGAYEFQAPTSLLSYAWAQQFGLPTDGSADFTDNDADLLNNWQEWRAGTIPTNALSVLRLLTPASDGTNLTVTWESVTGRSYFLERSAEISNTSAFTRFATNIQGQASTTFFVDTNVVGASPRFYRVGLQ